MTATLIQGRTRFAADSHTVVEVAPDVTCVRLPIVNAYLVGAPGAGDRQWVLVDCGLYGSAPRIMRAAAEKFAPGARPAAIVLTHGHFDHVGSLKPLSTAWDVPVYAHHLEMPFLNGMASYPPPDPSVGGGAMARLSKLYPRGPVNVSNRLRLLPLDGTIPVMEGWRWVHTPGHTPGHVSPFRESDATLIVGDAFVTTRQESMLWAMAQPEEVNGPPAYYTPDWELAGRSVRELARLEPEVAATGHGMPMRGAEMRKALHELAVHFQELAVPRRGRYVERPAIADERGYVSVPPAPDGGNRLGVVLAIAVGYAACSFLSSSRCPERSTR